MDDQTHLTEELSAAREELTRRERHHGTPGEGGITPSVEPHFRRLQTLSAEELEAHIERLERDLADLERGVEAWNAPAATADEEADRASDTSD
jgi:DNA repair exonuclease SbcCD ATPase subunit